MQAFYFFNLKKIFMFREGKGGRKRGRGTSMCGCLSRALLLGTVRYNPGMSPDWESNQRPFGLRAGTQSTEPHQPGLMEAFSRKQKLGSSGARMWMVGLRRGRSQEGAAGPLSAPQLRKHSGMVP